MKDCVGLRLGDRVAGVGQPVQWCELAGILHQSSNALSRWPC